MILQMKLPLYAETEIPVEGDERMREAWAGMCRAENALAHRLSMKPLGAVGRAKHGTVGWMLWPHDGTGKMALFRFEDTNDPDCVPVARCDIDWSQDDVVPSSFYGYTTLCQDATDRFVVTEASKSRLDLMLRAHSKVLMRELGAERSAAAERFGVRDEAALREHLYYFLGGGLVANVGYELLPCVSHLLNAFQMKGWSPQQEAEASLQEMHDLFGQAKDIWARLDDQTKRRCEVYPWAEVPLEKCIQGGYDATVGLLRQVRRKRESESSPTL